VEANSDPNRKAPMSDTVVLDGKLIDSGRSKAGGWSREQFRLIGVKWPAKKGWKRKAIGRAVPHADLLRFVELKDNHLEEKRDPWQERAKPKFVSPAVATAERIEDRYAPVVGEMLHLTLMFDGACTVNPGGSMSFGWHVVGSDGERLANGSGPIPGYPKAECTNNVAEYEALIRGLEWVSGIARPVDTLTIYGDSQLVIRQVNGDWKNKKPHLQKLMQRVQKLLKGLDVGHVELSWVPRESNTEADRLSKR